MHTDKNEPPCGSACGTIAKERNRYFPGKYMTARDFQCDPDYLLSRQHLHNRLLHGMGIICGLEVKPHWDQACRKNYVEVTAGIAIDCCGREVILEKPEMFKVWEPPAEPPISKNMLSSYDEQAMDKQDEARDYSSPEHQAHDYENDREQLHKRHHKQNHGVNSPQFMICLRYQEEEIEFVPALYSEGACDPNLKEANRVRERAVLVICDPKDLAEGCWKKSASSDEEEAPESLCVDDCGEEAPGPHGACLEPSCICGDCIPLALITPRWTGNGYTIEKSEIDLSGRRSLPLSKEYLTHIVHINWPHGGVVSLSHLRETMKGRLEIRFDRKLLMPIYKHSKKMPINGISPYTFVVQFGGVQRDIEFLPYDYENAPHLENECVAIFTIDRKMLGRYDNIAGNMVYVTLKCDFILDCYRNPVDGNHLGGMRPTGDGVPGGVFESWFRVVPDEKEYEEEE